MLSNRTSTRTLAALLSLSAAACEGQRGPDQAPPDTGQALSSALIAERVDRYFNAYRSALNVDGGSVDLMLWTEATLRGGPAYRVFAHDALDLALGFDFVAPPHMDPDYCTPINEVDDRPGHIRAVSEPEVSLKLLDAVREAVRSAILNKSQSAVRAPIEWFFAENPNYHPMHTGRCYPHGHAYYTERGLEPKECIIESVGGLVALLVQDVVMLDRLQRETTATETSGLQTQPSQPQQPKPNCNCYYSDDCSGTQICGGYGLCDNIGKKDGTCRTNPNGGGGNPGGNPGGGGGGGGPSCHADASCAFCSMDGDYCMISYN